MLLLLHGGGSSSNIRRCDRGDIIFPLNGRRHGGCQRTARRFLLLSRHRKIGLAVIL